MKIPLEQVIKEYKNGTSLKNISTEIRIPIRIIKSELLQYGGKRGQEILMQELEKEFPMIKAMVQDYQERKNVQQLSKQYHLTENMTRNVIRQYQTIVGEKTSKKYTTNYREDLQTDQIIEEFRNGELLSKIANDNDASVTAIRYRVDNYIEEHGNQIVEERKNAIEKQQGSNPYRILLPIEKIYYEREVLKHTYAQIEEKYHVSITTIKKRLKDYKAQIEKRKNTKANNENDKIEENNYEIIDLPIIIKYFRFGYSLDKVQKFAKENGHPIKESDIETARKIENGELKVATEESIANIIEKYGYSYEELTEIGKKKGYVILKEFYASAKVHKNIQNKGKNKKSLEGEEK